MSSKTSAGKMPDLDVTGATSNEKIARIRDIVFGSQMREYAQRFDNIHRDLARLQQEINRLLDLVNEQNRSLSQQLREGEGRLAAQLQESARGLGDRLQELDTRYTSQRRDLELNLDSRLKDLERRHGDRMREIEDHNTLRAEEIGRLLRETEDSIRADLHENADHLSQVKMDRFMLGDMLVEVGNSLREGTAASMVAGLLEHLAAEVGQEPEQEPGQGE